MKRNGTKIASLLLALVLLVSPLGNLGVTVSAEETTATNAYVLQFKPDGLAADYAYNKPYLYTTPFTVDHTITKPNGEEYYSGGNFPEVFNLINTTKLGQSGDYPYASIAAYCTDASTGTRENSNYRRINLEDSTYAGGAAGKIRAVVLKSYPRVDVSSIEAAANQYLRAWGLPEITGLQSGEAILATQIAIWKLANGKHYTINTFFAGMQDLNADWLGDYLSSDVVYTDNTTQTETENTAQNIESLYTYLYNLDPVGPMYDAVSESSFEKPVYSAVKAEDGTYTIKVSVNINTRIGEGDSLTLTAACGEDVISQAVTEAGTHTVTFTGLSDRLAVKLELNGYQNGGDVYLFDAEGERSASQSMVGYDNSLLPVHGELNVTPDRILNITKSTSEDTGKKPLANISFDIYKVATLAQLESGNVKLSEKPDATETAKYQTAANHVVTLTTDVQGFATYNFTENNMPDGVYLIVEQPSAATTGPIEAFYIVVPGTTTAGDGYAYTINVSPKNTTETPPKIEKDVTEIGNNSDSFDVDETHTWIIRSGIPAGIANAVKYTISDTIDYRLTYQTGSPVVKLYTRAGEELLMSPDIHYTLTEGKVTVEERSVDRFVVDLTDEGMTFVAQSLDSGEATPEIRVYFSAVINEHASMGETIPNQAHLDYTNSAGVEYDEDSDKPEVHTGGINLLKTDAADEVLSGASFKVARLATEAEIADETIQKETLVLEEEELTVVFVDFHATKDMSGEKVYEVTTDENGAAVIYGLAYGTYYIVETKAPAGYNLLTQPIAVIIDAASHLTEADGWKDTEGKVVDNTVHVVNTKFILPQTGGMGTTVFTVAGLGLMGTAGFLLLINRKKKAC